jgi:hypothetical protein
MQPPPPAPNPNPQPASVRHDSMVDAAMFKPPSRLPVVVGTLVGLFVGALLSGVITATVAGQSTKGKGKVKVAESAAPATSTSAASSAAPSSAPGPRAGSLAARAAAGDAAARKEIEGKPLAARSAEEVLALSQATVAAERKELDDLAHKIALVPKVAKEDKAVADRLKELIQDRAIAPDVLAMFAKLPANTGPDLLYEVASSSRKNETTALADDLLYAKDVRPKASLELAPLLDLRKAEKCEDVAKALADVKRDADRRAFVPLLRYQNKRGCGEKKNEDCWPCLRDGDLLKDSLTAVQKRPPPPIPSL